MRGYSRDSKGSTPQVYASSLECASTGKRQNDGDVWFRFRASTVRFSIGLLFEADTRCWVLYY